MPSKPLAAKASVFNGNSVDDVASTVATEPDFTEEGFYNDFYKMLGFFYCDIVLGGCIWVSFGPARQEASRQRRWVQQGCAGTAGPSSGTGTSRSCASNRGEWCPTSLPRLPAGEGAEAGAGDPAPGEGAVQRPARGRWPRNPGWKIKLPWAYPKF